MPKSLSILASFNRSQFLSMKCLPPEIPKPNVCNHADAPTAHTSCVIELYDGAPAVGGADLILDVVEFVVVELDSLPDS
jgi:hypothetical protein